MDSAHITSIIIFFICIILSAYFSSSETAFTSARAVKLKTEAKNGDRSAARAVKLQNRFEEVLSTILIGNNLVNIASSSVATIFFVSFYPTYGATISTIVTTIILLLLAEITPKLLAKLAPEKIAKLSSPILEILLVIFKPLVWLLTQWQRMIKKILPVSSVNALSEEELLSFVDEARVDGSIEHEEHRLVKAAIEFDDVDVSTILTPRVDVIGVDIEDSDDKIESTFDQHPFSRLIVYDESVDNVVGVLHQKDFHRYLRAKHRNQLRVQSVINLVSEVLYVPPVIKLSDLLRLMQRNKNHMAVVVDEHGGMSGIATMEDALEELVGEIWDETDVVENEIEELDEDVETYLVKGTYSIEKLLTQLELNISEDWISNTVSGFVIEQLERVPKSNDSFQYGGYEFIVLDAQKRRVNEVLIKAIEKDEEIDEEESD
ncbi:MAG TPA: hemolysin family protein [Alloiococcus sp.]|nr:hemolysin family protein [Alloiococcus sp.]